jgi:hypothetical protein
MNSEAFKLARDTLRVAVKEYGWRRHWTVRDGRTGLVIRTRYVYGPGKFESEHWAIVHYWRALLDGDSDEPFSTGEEVDGTPFPVTDDERAAFGFAATTQFVVIWHSSQGFESLQEITCEQYDQLREQYDNPCPRCDGTDTDPGDGGDCELCDGGES